jgi:hypothetical protein
MPSFVYSMMHSLFPETKDLCLYGDLNYNPYVLGIFLSLVTLFFKEPSLQPIVEIVFILRGGVNQYKIIFTLFNHSSIIL